MALESKWELDEALCIYRRQGHLYRKPYGAATVQVASFVIIGAGWAVLLPRLPS